MISPVPEPSFFDSIKQKAMGAWNNFAHPAPIRVMFTQPTPTPTQIPTPTPFPTPEHMTPYEQQTLPTVQKWGIPPEVFYGIRNAEGGKINGFNLGAHDSNPGNAMTFDNILAEATAAARILSGNATPITYPNREQGAENFRNAMAQKNPEDVIRAIQDAGYAGDPTTWRSRSIATGGAGMTYPSWSSFVMDTPAWIKWSNQ